MSVGPLEGVGMTNSVIAPEVVMRPILLAAFSVNHSAQSGGLVISEAKPLLAVGIGNTVTTPALLMRSTSPPAMSHTAPSGPVVTSEAGPAVIGNWVITPAGVKRATSL